MWSKEEELERAKKRIELVIYFGRSFLIFWSQKKKTLQVINYAVADEILWITTPPPADEAPT